MRSVETAKFEHKSLALRGQGLLLLTELYFPVDFGVLIKRLLTTLHLKLLAFLAFHLLEQLLDLPTWSHRCKMVGVDVVGRRGEEESVFVAIVPVLVGLSEMALGVDWLRRWVQGAGRGDSKKLILSCFIYLCMVLFG